MKKKLIYIIFAACAVTFIVLAAQADVTSAYANTCKSGESRRNPNNVNHTGCAYSIKIKGYTYSVSLDIYHCKTHYSASTACQVAINESKSHLSPTTLSGNWAQACGNGWGTYSARIIAKPIIATTTSPVIISVLTATTTTTIVGTPTIVTVCTPGVNCPDADLGKIITQTRLNPIARTLDNKCPFFWTVGNEDAKRKIECSIISNGVTTIVPKIQTDPVNGYLLPVGQSNFVCSRGDGTSTTTETKILTCSGNPAFVEN